MLHISKRTKAAHLEIYILLQLTALPVIGFMWLIGFDLSMNFDAQGSISSMLGLIQNKEYLIPKTSLCLIIFAVILRSISWPSIGRFFFALGVSPLTYPLILVIAHTKSESSFFLFTIAVSGLLMPVAISLVLTAIVMPKFNDPVKNLINNSKIHHKNK
ncbi:hypothetical protein [Aliivibrio fischeri]|uniref:hypothetical protein n=1 Tax=Aliivibrio fischeri TaxID=668 RepID=UPI0012901E44|nr:hypothetical protein [Aliivibrio fischeri]